MMLNTPTFANNFDFIWIVSYSHLVLKLLPNTTNARSVRFLH